MLGTLVDEGITSGMSEAFEKKLDIVTTGHIPKPYHCLERGSATEPWQ